MTQTSILYNMTNIDHPNPYSKWLHGILWHSLEVFEPVSATILHPRTIIINIILYNIAIVRWILYYYKLSISTHFILHTFRSVVFNVWPTNPMWILCGLYYYRVIDIQFYGGNIKLLYLFMTPCVSTKCRRFIWRKI